MDLTPNKSKPGKKRLLRPILPKKGGNTLCVIAVEVPCIVYPE